MPIINNYDTTKFIISDLSEKTIRRIVDGRKFAVIMEKSDPSIGYTQRMINWNLKLGIVFDAYALRIDDFKKTKRTKYLYIWKNEEGFKQHKRFFKPDGSIEVVYPSVEELINMICGKVLIFSAYFAEEHCGVERTLNRKLQEYVFNLRNEKEFYLYDEFFDVKVFLKRISNDRSDAMDCIQPVDIWNFDIYSKIFSVLKKECRVYDDILTEKYTSVSDKLQAHYFLAKFHSNRNWGLDPVCILNYRTSAFVLPCSATKEDITFPQNKIAFNFKDRLYYIIDSIHVNSDICFDLSEFEYLIKGFMTDIDLA